MARARGRAPGGHGIPVRQRPRSLAEGEPGRPAADYDWARPLALDQSAPTGPGNVRSEPRRRSRQPARHARRTYAHASGWRRARAGRAMERRSGYFASQACRVIFLTAELANANSTRPHVTRMEV